MIDISNFTDPSPELFDLNLCQKEVDGGMINYHQIDEIVQRCDVK